MTSKRRRHDVRPRDTKRYMNDALRVEYVPLSEVLGWPQNPKAHDLPALSASVARFGFNDPPAVDEATGRLVEGHGRVDALRVMRERGDEPPARVHVRKDGEWLVPILRGLAFDSEAEAEAYLLSHNRVSEIGGWDNAALASMFSDREWSEPPPGWTNNEVERLLEKHGDKELENVEFPKFDEDSAAGVVVHECPKCGHKFS